MDLGRKIYYDNQSGEVIVDTFERSGSLKPISTERDIEVYTELSKRNRETFDVLELPFGAYSQDFAVSTGYRMNVESKTLEFSYPDPNSPDVEQIFQVPMSEEVSSLKEENLQNMMAMVDMYENNLRLEAENASIMMAVAELYETMLGSS